MCDLVSCVLYCPVYQGCGMLTFA